MYAHNYGHVTLHFDFNKDSRRRERVSYLLYETQNALYWMHMIFEYRHLTLSPPLAIILYALAV